jgi:hypothetical protein
MNPLNCGGHGDRLLQVRGGRSLVGICLTLTAVLVLCACGVPSRDNPLDPGNPHPVDVAALLVGTWSRVDAEANEIYAFRADGHVELHAYAARGSWAVNRNAPADSVAVITYSGSYTLYGRLLRLSFSAVAVNGPDDALPPLPAADPVVKISVEEQRLTLHQLDGDRVYTRL